MGLDGGTKITRSDVLRGQSWRVASQDNSRSTRGGSVTTGPAPKPADEQHAERVATWTTCSISGDTLHAPVVADALGKLYNKDSVVELLLAKRDIFVDGQRSVHQYANRLRTAPGAFSHLNSLKDVFEVHLGHSQQQGQQQEGAGAASGNGSSLTSGLAGAPAGASAVAQGAEDAVPYRCPVTALPCARYPFSALRRCGHVLSDRALAAAQDSARSCPLCGKAYKEKDRVALNGSSNRSQAAAAADSEAQASSSERKRKRQPADG